MKINKQKKALTKSPGQSEFLILNSLLLFITWDIRVHEFQLLRVPCIDFYHYPGTFNMNTIWSVMTISSSCSASSNWFLQILSSIATVLQKISQPAEVLSLNWCLLLFPPLSLYFLEGIPDKCFELYLLQLLGAIHFPLKLILVGTEFVTHYFPKRQFFSQR